MVGVWVVAFAALHLEDAPKPAGLSTNQVALVAAILAFGRGALPPYIVLLHPRVRSVRVVGVGVLAFAALHPEDAPKQAGLSTNQVALVAAILAFVRGTLLPYGGVYSTLGVGGSPLFVLQSAYNSRTKW